MTELDLKELDLDVSNSARLRFCTADGTQMQSLYSKELSGTHQTLEYNQDVDSGFLCDNEVCRAYR